MSELTTTKLNAESHLLLDQPLLRLPHEVARKNFKTVQKHVEREKDVILSSLKSTANASLAGQDADTSLASLDTMITRMQGLKRKIESLHEEEKVLHQQTRRRIKHLQDLYEIPSLADVKYEEWSRIRLNRLLIDYLLRCGYGDSAMALAKEKSIEDLVDLNVFVQCHKIEQSLRNRSTTECLAWCAEHRPLMKKTNNQLEFELRVQQYIEMKRSSQMREARQHLQKYVLPPVDSKSSDTRRSNDTLAGILAYPANTRMEPFKTMFSQARWDALATTFVKTHHELYSLPSHPLLHIALSAGLSALKTPSCHSKYASSTANASSSTTSVCPICSTELNELARGLPYAHHTKSHVENDPIVLPNGRLYGRDRLLEMSAKVGLSDGWVKDPTTAEVFEASKISKVYIS